jgi:hypothetical protein
MDAKYILPIIMVGSIAAWIMVCLTLGCIELIISGKLKRRAQQIKGRITYVDLKAERVLIGSRVYGEVEFTYQVNNVTYRKRQTVDGLTARVLLPYESREVTVLFLPQNPSVARLFMASRDHKRMYNFFGAIGFLGFVILLILFILLVAISSQSDY